MNQRERENVLTARRPRKPYTEFGRLMQLLMVQRDIRSWTELQEVIEKATGNTYLHQSMSRYAAGTVKIPVEFVQDFATTLELSEPERSELAYQYTYHSREAQRHIDTA